MNDCAKSRKNTKAEQGKFRTGSAGVPPALFRCFDTGTGHICRYPGGVGLGGLPCGHRLAGYYVHRALFFGVALLLLAVLLAFDLGRRRMTAITKGFRYAPTLLAYFIFVLVVTGASVWMWAGMVLFGAFRSC